MSKITFVDIDGVIWPEMPVLMEVGKVLFPQRKSKLELKNLRTLSGKTEINTPPLLAESEVKEIFQLYEDIEIFKYPLSDLPKILTKKLKTPISIDTRDLEKNIDYLQKSSKTSPHIFVTARGNYTDKNRLERDTKEFLTHYNCPPDVLYKFKGKTKGELIVDTITDQTKEICVIEDNILEVTNIMTSLNDKDVNYSFKIIDYPWNQVQDNKEEFLKIFDSKYKDLDSTAFLDKLIEHIDKKIIIKLNNLSE